METELKKITKPNSTLHKWAGSVQGRELFLLFTFDSALFQVLIRKISLTIF